MKILVIRFLAIGDVVLTSSLCSSLRKSFPDAQIDYLMHAASGPLFDHHPDIDNVIRLSPQERKSAIKYLRKAWAISRNNYDIILDATSTEKSQFISLFSRKTKYRIGRAKGKKGFTFTHKISPEALQGNKIAQRMVMLQPLKAAGLEIQEVPQMTLTFTPTEKAELKQRMVDQGIDFQRPIFALSVSSKIDAKKWRLEYMTEVIQHCLNKYQAQILIFAGMPHERPDIEQIYNALGKHADVFIDVDCPSLRELGALLCNCDIFIGNEGGPRHIAHAVGLPSATVFSPHSRLDEWLPERGTHHQGIEWQDIIDVKSGTKTEFEYGDSVYFELYNRIKPEHFIPIIDHVIDGSQVLNQDTHAQHS